jgi:hypothetical protein
MTHILRVIVNLECHHFISLIYYVSKGKFRETLLKNHSLNIDICCLYLLIIWLQIENLRIVYKV